MDFLVEVGEGRTSLKVHTKSEDPAIVHLMKRVRD
jgi:hypothetical protein